MMTRLTDDGTAAAAEEVDRGSKLWSTTGVLTVINATLSSYIVFLKPCPQTGSFSKHIYGV